MKRDMDLIRTILLNVEADKYPYGGPVYVDGVPGEICARHFALLIEAGLAEGHLVNSNVDGIVGAILYRLTWAGHDFLEAARSDTVWNKAKAKVIQPGLSWTFSMLVAVVKAEASAQMQKHGLPPLG
jgi:hypothetical protein